MSNTFHYHQFAKFACGEKELAMGKMQQFLLLTPQLHYCALFSIGVDSSSRAFARGAKI